MLMPPVCSRCCIALLENLRRLCGLLAMITPTDSTERAFSSLRLRTHSNAAATIVHGENSRARVVGLCSRSLIGCAARKNLEERSPLFCEQAVTQRLYREETLRARVVLNGRAAKET